MENPLPHSRGTDSGLVLAATTLMAISLVMVATATVAPDRPLIHDAFWSGTFCRQLIFVAVGLLLIGVTSKLVGPVLRSPELRFRVAILCFGMALFALLLALLPGFADPRRGSHRWLSLAPLGLHAGFQPSEFAKPALILMLSALLTRFDPRSLRRGLLPAAAAIGVCVGLVGSEDFGTSALLAGSGAAMLLVAGCRWRYLAAIAVVGIAGMIALIYAEPYRLERITAYQNVWTDTQGAAYQPHQSLVTIASGGWFGRGLGSGIQKYGYLPEGHTDFIFAVICEETGVVGAAVVIGLFGTVAWLGLSVARGARDPFIRLLAVGLTTTLVFQAVLNMAVVTVLTPTTGISLPFISAGGSGLISACLSIGILGAIARQQVRASQPEQDA